MKTKTNRRTLTKLLTLGFLGIAGAGLFNAPSASALPLTDLPSVGDWSNSIFNPSIPHIDYNTTDGEAVDSDLGAIVLEILDEEGKAVPGAVFEIDGVRAHRTMKSYVYDKDFGMYSQFTADDNGKVVINGVNALRNSKDKRQIMKWDAFKGKEVYGIRPSVQIEGLKRDDPFFLMSIEAWINKYDCEDAVAEYKANVT